jgi:predicted Zn-dependent peptidase
LAFLFEEISALKRQLKPEKVTEKKKRKVESLLSTEIILTTSSNENEE